MTLIDKRKRSLYIPDKLLKEMQHEARRQDRSLSWIVQQAWCIARVEIVRLPSISDVFKDKDDSEDINP
jgi:uncharacterized small protein (TIGR04563 family)